MSDIAARFLGRFGLQGNSSQDRRTRGATSARIMVPRIVFGVTAFTLTLFGLLMIYSASSITGLTSQANGNDPAYFLFRQAIFAALGTIGVLILSYVDYHVWKGISLKVAWGFVFVLLILVFTPLAGRDVYGASRWIGVAGFTIQPSEFAKIVLLLVGANIAEQYFALGTIDTLTALKLAFGGIALPLLLVLAQPDKGTVGVVCITLLVMIYLSGVSGKYIMAGIVCVVAGVLIYALKDDYSRARIFTLLNPFSDEFGSGYQLTRGFFAFGTGGLQGLGLGMSRQKYNYLPMAHTDFIFAVIGEELGFLGAAGMVVAFGVLLWSGLKIAENAPDLFGRLIAAGCTSLLIIQLLLNLTGVMGMVPLSGKPVPFVSYGGSSILSTLLMVGLVMSVSVRSTLPETSHDRKRAQIHLADADYGYAGPGTLQGSTAGAVRSRSPRLRSVDGVAANKSAGSEPSPAARRQSWQVHDGGNVSFWDTPREREKRAAQTAGRVTVDARGRKRVDLGPSPSERLRGSRNNRD
ncbi:MAG: putative peptidoglycan glycosyltransferase FtsW [Coriobacteriales bacterium]|nr:putative peptidoglycan glycosyltransferase FtsW [Coriobacteriales bacterium]